MHTPLILVVSSLFASTLAGHAGLQDTPPARDGGSESAEATGHHAVVTGKKVNVRTSASVEGGYHFFKVNEGDLVSVLYERFGWSRVRMDTPVFRKAFGYVTADAIEADGSTGTLIARARFNAPNATQSNRSDMSWEGLDPILEPGMTLELVELIPASSAGDPAKWKVAMPERQEAWINSNWLRKATPAEIEAKLPKVMADETSEKTTTDADVDAEPATTELATGETTGQLDDDAEIVETGTDAGTEVVATTEEEGDGAGDLSDGEGRTARLAALDKAFRLALKERIESAELEILQTQFVQFADLVNVTEVEKKTALARADVLGLKVAVQDQLARLREMRERTQIDIENIGATRVAMDARAPYDVVGRLNASVVFSGEGSMPLLFRLQDTSGGQTIAYIRPDERFDITAMTGLLVGIIGDSRYDEALQLNVVRPRRIDLLAPRGDAPESAESTQPAATVEVVEGEADGGEAD